MEIITKFSINDNAWFMKDNKPTKIIISAIETFSVDTKQHIKYNGWDAINRATWIDHTNISEDCLFPSKEELLKSL